MIDRTRLQALLREQGLEGIVRADELARGGQVRGVDLMFLGTVTDFRLKRERTGTGVGLGRLTKNLGVGSVETESFAIKTDVAVDLKLVDTTSAEVVAAEIGEMRRTDTADSWGVNVLGAGASVGSDVSVDASSRGRLLRVALDDALRKMLPGIDQYLLSWERPERPETPVASDGSPGSDGSGRSSSAGGGSGDYMPKNHYLAKSGARWKPALLQEEPVGELRKAKFVDVRTNDSFWTPDFVRTRPASSEDITTGKTLYVINLYDKGHRYGEAGQARKWWEDQFTYWSRATVTGTSGLERGVFQAPVARSSRDVHVSNARVPVEDSDGSEDSDGAREGDGAADASSG